MNNDLKIIKKYYGEKMMHLCRNLFSTIMERRTDKLSSLVLEHFSPSRLLYDDIVDNNLEEGFKNYIYNLIDLKDNKLLEVNESPKQLLKQVGYKLYICKTEKEIQKFKKYYSPGEELCTFDGGRLDRCFVFFAVKDNANKLKRENFSNPRRQDEYGTSVISIQFSIYPSHTLSIKNRYNHSVVNPDATFSNNLDNIVPGLTKAFEKYYGLKQEKIYDNFEIPGYIVANDGKYYKYNYEIDNVYYCPNNIIIDWRIVNKYEKEKYLIMDYFIIDLVNKKVSCFEESNDYFINSLGEIKNIKILNIDNNMKKVIITPFNGEDIVIILDKESRIVKLKNNNLKNIGDNFLRNNKVLNEIVLDNVETIGDDFLFNNIELNKIDLPKLKSVNNGFIYKNIKLSELKTDFLEVAGFNFLYSNRYLKHLNMPNLVYASHNFLSLNNSLETFKAPKLQEIGGCFLNSNNSLKYLSFPNLESVKFNFLTFNNKLIELDVPKLKIIDGSFLLNNYSLKVINAPNIEGSKDNKLYFNNHIIKKLKMQDQKRELINTLLLIKKDLMNNSKKTKRKD